MNVEPITHIADASNTAEAANPVDQAAAATTMHPILRRTVALAAAAGLLLGASSSANPYESDYQGLTSEINEPTPTALSDPEQAAYDKYFTLPYSACNLYSFPEMKDLVKQSAADCVAAEGGRIAVVNFGVDNVAVEATVQQSETALPAVTAGVVHPTLEVLPATKEAEAAFAAATADKGCEDAESPVEFASYAAETTMTDKLKQYDAIVAVTSEALCNPDERGIADGIRRHNADVQSGSAGGSTDTPSELARRMVHEVLHLYGVGHSGTIHSRGGDIFSDLYGNDITMQVGALNLDTYLAKDNAEYNEYGDDTSVMGSVTAENVSRTTLNPVNQSVLSRPEQIVDGQPQSDHSTESGPASITLAEAKKGAFITVELQQPIQLEGWELKSRQVFDHLALVPRIDTVPGTKPDMWAVGINLINSSNVVASLGLLYRDSKAPNKPFIITSGNQKISLTLSSGSLKVTQTS
jgi:hypothetical protein